MPTKSAVLRNGLVAVLISVPTLALAHTSAVGASGVIYGLAHPIGGIDHVLGMIAVGVFAANLGGRAFWAVPLAFMTLMAAGSAAGILGMHMPYAEVGIALSIVVLGVVITVRFEWPVATAMTLVGLFAVFHGHAHGTEMPVDASGAAYALGLVTATGLLHLSGVAIGIGITTAGLRHSPRIMQSGGAAFAVAGLLVLSRAI